MTWFDQWFANLNITITSEEIKTLALPGFPVGRNNPTKSP
jgi:hypothetical protein